jgi:hypothetical protein
VRAGAESRRRHPPQRRATTCCAGQQIGKDDGPPDTSIGKVRHRGTQVMVQFAGIGNFWVLPDGSLVPAFWRRAASRQRGVQTRQIVESAAGQVTLPQRWPAEVDDTINSIIDDDHRLPPRAARRLADVVPRRAGAAPVEAIGPRRRRSPAARSTAARWPSRHLCIGLR